MVIFQSYGIPLDSVKKIKYPWRVFTASHDKWPAVVPNMWKSWSIWERFHRIFGQEGAYTQNSGTFYKGLVNVTLQFGSETWVMNLRIGRTLGGFHKQCGLPYGRNATEAVHT